MTGYPSLETILWPQASDDPYRSFSRLATSPATWRQPLSV
jgi:hypothetical protein